MTFNHQHCTTRNAVKKPHQRYGLHLFLFLFVYLKCFWNKTLDQITTRKGFSSQNKIETRYYIVLF